VCVCVSLSLYPVCDEMRESQFLRLRCTRKSVGCGVASAKFVRESLFLSLSLRMRVSETRVGSCD